MSRVNSYIGLIAAAMLLAACDSLPGWMGGEEEKGDILPGERITVLPVEENLQPDASLKSLAVTLPPAFENPDWAQHTGVVTAGSSNLSIKGGMDSQQSAGIGEGEEFEHPLVPRPVVAGGTVFAMDAVGNISAHEAANIDNQRWESEGVAEEDEPETMGGGLAFDQGRLYAVSGRGVAAAFDASNGQQLWRKNVRIPFRSAPRVVGSKVFAITIDNQIFAFNAANGDVLWNQRGIDETTGLMNSVSPAVSGDTVVVPYSSGQLYALSAIDGRELWNDSLMLTARTEASGVFSGISGDPVIDGEVVFAVSSSGLLAVFGLVSGQPIWDRPVASLNTPWITGDYLFLLTADNTLVCFVKYSGAVVWSTKLASYEDEEEKKDPIIWRGPVMADGKLIVVGSHGEMTLINAQNGSVIATKSIPDDIRTAPVIAEGRMYLVSQDATLYSLQ